MFYAGLLENHGPRGDRSVMELGKAIELIKTYFDEHKTDGKGNFYEVLVELMQVMGDDGFFEMIGLENVLNGISEAPKKAPKTPQDHKKPTKKTTKTTPEVTGA